MIVDRCMRLSPPSLLSLEKANKLADFFQKTELKDLEVVYPLLKELVRLHEHVHVYIHTSGIRKSRRVKERFADWSDEMHEPLAEFIDTRLLNRITSL